MSRHSFGLRIYYRREKNDSALQHRRESAPAHTLSGFDANKTRDEKYNKAMYKFNQWRANDQNVRSMLQHSDQSSDHRYGDDSGGHDECNADHRRTSTSHHFSAIESSELDDDVLLADGGGRNSFCSHPTSDFFRLAPQQPCVGGNISRQSLPSNMNKHKSKRSKKPHHDPSTIHEDEVKEYSYDAYHCYENLGGVGIRTPFNSPPMKFYKENSNPYAATTMTQAQSSTQVSSHRPCPEKPKRIMLKQQNTSLLTRELSGAHFNGAYQNYEIQSPFYAADSDRVSERPIIAAGIRAAAMPSSSSNYTGDECGSTALHHRASGHYQLVRNDYGEEVEYALPMIERQHSSGDHQFRPSSVGEPNYDDEVFAEDPRECERIVGQMYNDEGECTRHIQLNTDPNRI